MRFLIKPFGCIDEARRGKPIKVTDLMEFHATFYPFPLLAG